jgi:hypothetical protein
MREEVGGREGEEGGNGGGRGGRGIQRSRNEFSRCFLSCVAASRGKRTHALTESIICLDVKIGIIIRQLTVK